MSETKTVAAPVVVLGVTGGIAAYKAADLVSKMVQRGMLVHVIMTRAAQEFVTPRTFLTLSRQPVTTSLWETPEWKPEHVAMAQEADLLVIAPCSANMLGKMAHGIADDALSTYILAHEKPVIVAPAMNPAMWRNAAVRDNVALLRRRGVIFAGPVSGHVACGGDGEGRMAEPMEILAVIERELERSRA